MTVEDKPGTRKTMVEPPIYLLGFTSQDIRIFTFQDKWRTEAEVSRTRNNKGRLERLLQLKNKDETGHCQSEPIANFTIPSSSHLDCDSGQQY